MSMYFLVKIKRLFYSVLSPKARSHLEIFTPSFACQMCAFFRDSNSVCSAFWKPESCHSQPLAWGCLRPLTPFLLGFWVCSVQPTSGGQYNRLQRRKLRLLQRHQLGTCLTCLQPVTCRTNWFGGLGFFWEADSFRPLWACSSPFFTLSFYISSIFFAGTGSLANMERRCMDFPKISNSYNLNWVTGL